MRHSVGHRRRRRSEPPPRGGRRTRGLLMRRRRLVPGANVGSPSADRPYHAGGGSRLGAIGAIEPLTRNPNARPALEFRCQSRGISPGATIEEPRLLAARAPELGRGPAVHSSGCRQAVRAHQADAHALSCSRPCRLPGSGHRGAGPLAVAYRSRLRALERAVLCEFLGCQLPARVRTAGPPAAAEVEVRAKRHVVDVVMTIEKRKPGLRLHNPVTTRPVNGVVHDDQQVRHDGGRRDDSGEKRARCLSGTTLVATPGPRRSSCTSSSARAARPFRSRETSASGERFVMGNRAPARR